MKLNTSDLHDRHLWLDKGFELPQFDLEEVKQKTLASPAWVHFGAGNIFRAFLCAAAQTLLDNGIYDRGVIVVGGYDYETIEMAYRPYDNLSLLVVLKADGTIDKRVIGSIAESLVADPENKAEWDRLTDIFENPSLQMVSFTITEKGYSLVNGSGEYLPAVLSDFANMENPKSTMGKIAALCYKRYLKGEYPVALVSMDNMSHNGDKLSSAVKEIAQKWVENNLVEKNFLSYLGNKSKVSFPWSMIDKITPRPDANVLKMLKEDGFEDADLIITSKNTYIAPFVNAEEAEYLVIEDDFSNGRPPLEHAGVIFTDKETVDMVERMKVCTCLNPLHTALAVFGCLLSYDAIYKEMRDSALKELVRRIGYEEGMPVVVDPKIISPPDFIKEVLEVRFPNPFILDTPQRIATDTSQKLPIRFGETIKAYMGRKDLDVAGLKLIPLVFAAWCRYLLGVNDLGEDFTVSPEPMLDELQSQLKGIRIGDTSGFKEKLKPILSNDKIFGVDLYKAGLGEKVENYFAAMIAGKGAVRRTLENTLKP